MCTFLHRYFLLCVNYFFYGETVTDYFFTLVQREEPLRILSKYHRFISFALYLTGTDTESPAFIHSGRSVSTNPTTDLCFPLNRLACDEQQLQMSKLSEIWMGWPNRQLNYFLDSSLDSHDTFCFCSVRSTALTLLWAQQRTSCMSNK